MLDTRFVVTLFSDLVGSTASREALGATAADDFAHEHLRVLTHVVERHGGAVVKTVGDGVHASFPLASSALDAAAGCQWAARRHGRARGIDVAMRIGISAGEVTVGADGDPQGRSVIEAARLCASAPAGHVRVADVAVRIADGRHRCELSPQGTVELKGLDAPIAVHEVAWRADEPVFPLPLALGAAPPLFGRDRELGQLHDLWKTTSTGSGCAVLITGDAGIGKSSLAAHMASSAHTEGAVVLACRWSDATPDLAPMLGAVGFLVEEVFPRLPYPTVHSNAIGLVSLVPALAPYVGEALPAEGIADLASAVSYVLRAAYSYMPVLFVAEDVDRAGESALAVLGPLLASAWSVPLMIVATARSDRVDRAGPLRTLVAKARREGHLAPTIAVGGLDAGSLADLAVAIRGDGSAPVARWLLDRTGGNPFFAVELLRDPDVDVARVLVGHGHRVPVTLQEAIGRRADELGRVTRRLLEAASVLGTSWTTGLVASIAGLGDAEAERAHDDAVAAGLVTSSRGEYRFVHALVAEGLLGRLPESERRHLHRRAAEVLDHSSRPPAAAIARHEMEAAALDDTERLLPALVRAGDAAREQLAYADAAGWYERALELVTDGARPDDEIDVSLALADVAYRAGLEGARTRAMTAARLARRRGDARRLAQALLVEHREFFSRLGAVDAERLGLLEVALATEANLDDRPTHARLAAEAAMELVWSDDVERRRQLTTEALVEARELADPSTLAFVLERRVLAVDCWDNVQESLLDCNELLDIALQSADLRLQFRAAVQVSGLAAQAADRATMDRALRVASSLSADVPGPLGDWMWPYVDAGVALLDGRVDDAERRAGDALSYAMRSGSVPEAAIFYGGQLASIRAAQGRLHELARPIGSMLRAAESDHALTLTRFAAAAGLADEARACYDQFVDEHDLTALPRDSLLGTTIVNLGRLAALYEDHATASVLVDLARPQEAVYARSTAVDQLGGHVLGTMLSLLGDVEGAEWAFEAAVARHRRFRAPLLLAETLVERARNLAPGHAADRWIAEATAIAERHGAPGLVAAAGAVR